MRTEQLEQQADSIEELLAAHGITAQVTGGAITPHWMRFSVLPGKLLGSGLSRIKNLGDELAGMLGVSSCQVSQRRRHVLIEIPRSDEGET